VNPGSALALEARLRKNGFRGAVLSNPEFLREGASLTDFDQPERRVIGGSDDDAVQSLAELYNFGDAPLIRTDATSAELIKVAVNAALALRVSMANEIATVALTLGADVETVLKGVGSDSRIGPKFLEPGIGFGGSCLPKDLLAFRAAAAAAGVPTHTFDGAANTNYERIDALVTSVAQLPRVKRGATICVAGVGFKPGTDSIRDSRGIALVQALRKHGFAVVVLDRLAENNARRALDGSIRYLDSFQEAVAQAAVIVAVHPVDPALLAQAGDTFVIDALGRLLPLERAARTIPVPAGLARI
jgi:UDPglucose 6-dehydrogenase